MGGAARQLPHPRARVRRARAPDPRPHPCAGAGAGARRACLDRGGPGLAGHAWLPRPAVAAGAGGGGAPAGVWRGPASGVRGGADIPVAPGAGLRAAAMARGHDACPRTGDRLRPLPLRARGAAGAAAAAVVPRLGCGCRTRRTAAGHPGVPTRCDRPGPVERPVAVRIACGHRRMDQPRAAAPVVAVARRAPRRRPRCADRTAQPPQRRLAPGDGMQARAPAACAAIGADDRRGSLQARQ